MSGVKPWHNERIHCRRTAVAVAHRRQIVVRPFDAPAGQLQLDYKLWHNPSAGRRFARRLQLELVCLMSCQVSRPELHCLHRLGSKATKRLPLLWPLERTLRPPIAPPPPASVSTSLRNYPFVIDTSKKFVIS
ncbi:hypothetical protein GQ600_26235 [Phytophthora cactorum]|nr:hypothetical protein GQ600_26235 [Phytophthora cactorum]